jgi:AraC-like DNA-binding protein
MAVLILLPDPIMRARLDTALRVDGGARADHHVRNWAEMREVALRSHVHLAIFDPYASGALDLDSVALFHEQFPNLVLLGYGDFARRSVRDTVRLVRVGVWDIVVRGEEDSPLKLRDLVDEALAPSLDGGALSKLRDLLPAHLVPLFRQLLSVAYWPLTPTDVAKLYHAHPNTLRKHLQAAGLPTVEKLIVWMHLFQAAYRLGDTPRTVESVALSLGFASASALRNQLRRYAGVTPHELRPGASLEVLLEEFRERWRVGNWALYGAKKVEVNDSGAQNGAGE